MYSTIQCNISILYIYLLSTSNNIIMKAIITESKFKVLWTIKTYTMVCNGTQSSKNITQFEQWNDQCKI